MFLKNLDKTLYSKFFVTMFTSSPHNVIADKQTESNYICLQAVLYNKYHASVFLRAFFILLQA